MISFSFFSKYLRVSALAIATLWTPQSNAINNQQPGLPEQKNEIGVLGRTARAALHAATASGVLVIANWFWNDDLLCTITKRISSDRLSCTDVRAGDALMTAFCLFVAANYAGISAQHIINMFDSFDHAIAKRLR